MASTQAVPVVRLNQGQERELALMRWGLIPCWAKDQKIAYKLMNARAESVQTSNAFREAYKRRHCLVVASAKLFAQRVGASPMRGIAEHGAAIRA